MSKEAPLGGDTDKLNVVECKGGQAQASSLRTDKLNLGAIEARARAFCTTTCIGSVQKTASSRF